MQSYIKRGIEQTILSVSQSYSAVIVTGPRQVGKTTTLRQLAPNRRYVTLDDIESRQLAQKDPELFLSLNPAPLLIDEVQYAPQLFSRIKIAVDSGAAPGAYWMTGSQTFRLMELAQESLAGRAAILRMTSLSQHEIYGSGELQAFKVDLPSLQSRVACGAKADTAEQYSRVWRGSMPGYVSGKFPQREVFYGSYLNSYIERDIGDMQSRVDSLQFSDFIRAAACRVGQLLNTHDIALDVGVSDDTAKRWLLLLEKSGVIFYLRPYSNNLLKRAVKTPKLYFFDTGLVAHLTKYSSAEILINGAINCAILENYVVAEILKSYSNLGIEPIAHYYRDRDGKEIDLILEYDGELHPIEIKKSASPPTEIVSAFKVLDSAALPRGTGAVICAKPELSAIDRGTAIVPAWAI
ncbi:MAG: ATP-binding protein [Clostridiales bacterium]|jgi:predicted AAA+ superfamily ATPase|nr:ATP-binding protein [Clostridiales bacterium]